MCVLHEWYYRLYIRTRDSYSGLKINDLEQGKYDLSLYDSFFIFLLYHWFDCFVILF